MSNAPLPSFDRLQSSLNDFLARKGAGALLLRGEWGVGKTYACLNVLKAKSKGKQQAFSYVSLYGVGTTEEIYTRVALGWINKVSEKVPDWMKEAGAHAPQALQAAGERLYGVGGLIGVAGGFVVGLMAKDTLVVIDDLERRDEGLSIKSAMGAISHLVESRNCKVILISNDDKLGEEKPEFERQKEKIFDAELTYEPSIRENAALVVLDNIDILLEPLLRLEVRNIRVMKRVASVVDCFANNLLGIPNKILSACLVNAAKIATLHYQHRGEWDAASLKSASTIELSILIWQKESELTTTDKLLAKIDFNPGPADSEILEYLRTGFIDWEALRERLNARSKYYEYSEARENVEAVYRRVQSNFAGTGEEVATAFEQACEKNPEFILPSTLSHVGSIIQRLVGRNPSKKWIERWKAEQLHSLSDEDLEDLRDHNLPPRLSIDVRAEQERRLGPKDIDSTVRRVAGEREAKSDREILMKFSEGEYYDWIAGSTATDLIPILDGLLEKLAKSRDPDKTIREKLGASLERIAKTSKLNELRVERFQPDSLIEQGE